MSSEFEREREREEGINSRCMLCPLKSFLLNYPLKILWKGEEVSKIWFIQSNFFLCKRTSWGFIFCLSSVCAETSSDIVVFLCCWCWQGCCAGGKWTEVWNYKISWMSVMLLKTYQLQLQPPHLPSASFFWILCHQTSALQKNVGPTFMYVSV